MITTDRTIMIVWFTPSRIDGFARGSWTLPSSCREVDPKATPASTISFGTCRMPRFVRRIRPAARRRTTR